MLFVEAVERLASKAVMAGNSPDTFTERDGTITINRRIRWDISGRCEAPVPVEVYGKHSAFHGKRVKPMTVILSVRCRSCMWCKNQRRRLWAERAVSEYNASERTWFGTLTLRPEEHYRALTQARKERSDYDALETGAKFSTLVQVIGRDLTLFMKRVRKNSRARFKYLIVAEVHKSGVPHFHVLIHERADEPVRKTVLDTAWRLGFSKFVLAQDARSAGYLCKYLSKDARTRIRASFRYGHT